MFLQRNTTVDVWLQLSSSHGLDFLSLKTIELSSNRTFFICDRPPVGRTVPDDRYAARVIKCYRTPKLTWESCEAIDMNVDVLNAYAASAYLSATEIALLA